MAKDLDVHIGPSFDASSSQKKYMSKIYYVNSFSHSSLFVILWGPGRRR